MIQYRIFVTYNNGDEAVFDTLNVTYNAAGTLLSFTTVTRELVAIPLFNVAKVRVISVNLARTV
jgi:hypothetical protein